MKAKREDVRLRLLVRTARLFHAILDRAAPNGIDEVRSSRPARR